MRGVQAGSAMVAGLPSVSARRIPVTGRQKSVSNLQSQAMIAASAMATFSMANRRAFSERVLPSDVATAAAMTFRWPPGVAVPAPLAQNKAMLVWSAVRVVLVAE